VRSFFLIAGLGCIALQAAGAQWPAHVTPGARVQVRLPEIQYQFDWVRGQPIRGRVASLASDTLYLAVGDSLGPLAVPRRLIQRLEYSKGVPSRLASATKRGLLSAAAFALVAAFINEHEDEPHDHSTGDVALVWGGLGLVTGAVLGAIFPIERWKKVRLK
jgi:predicted outer membrane lipoprotein